MSIDIFLFNTKSLITWEFGSVFLVDCSVNTLADLVRSQINNTTANTWLFWDAKLGDPPDIQSLQTLLDRQIDIWHAGLCLGMGGLPGILKFCQPASFFNRDPDPDIEATSWRLSLHACLIKSTVIRELGFLNPDFESLTAASLELGYRYINSGVIIRHTPKFLAKNAFCDTSIPLVDEFLFIHLTQGKNLKYWALFRSILTGYASWLRIVNDARRAFSYPKTQYRVYSPNQIDLDTIRLDDRDYRVTALIPTIERYPYLRVVLDQLRQQFIKPFEVIVVDQTDVSLRDLNIATDFSDLPLQIIYQDEAGQCSSRNAGLQISQGEYILFIDDDDEIEPDLIEKHLKNLQYFSTSVSSGKADDVGGLLSDIVNHIGLSGVFPTNNTLICREILVDSGLFDLAYNRGQTADGDLGMRIYLSGALMIYNPQISVLHHRAPRGGLRKHKARVITRASSRTNLLHRRLPHVTECYRMLRYFDEDQVREALWIAAVGTFSIQGGMLRKVLKVIVSTLLLPNTIYQVHQHYTSAKKMLRDYPQIPSL